MHILLSSVQNTVAIHRIVLQQYFLHQKTPSLRKVGGERQTGTASVPGTIADVKDSIIFLNNSFTLESRNILASCILPGHFITTSVKNIFIIANNIQGISVLSVNKSRRIFLRLLDKNNNPIISPLTLGESMSIIELADCLFDLCLSC